MVSMAHEVLVDLFKKRPSLAAEILADVLSVGMPAYSEARLASVDLTEIQPAEYRADVVVTLLHEWGRRFA
jgi:phage head maturation protease